MIPGAVIVSIAWVIAAISYFAIHIDYGCVISKCADGNASLRPNEFGDFLAGTFAPLAFLWLFVATMLQRQELSLQRQELRETREVLDLQKREMQRAADENSAQTKIMTENLKQEAARIEYDRLDTILYSAALYIFTNRRAYTLTTNTGAGYSIIPPNLDSIDKTNFDSLFATIFYEVHRAGARTKRGEIQSFKPGSPEQKVIFEETKDRLIMLKQINKTGNELIQARLDGLNFDLLSDAFETICSKIK